jgi:hypothetical protein
LNIVEVRGPSIVAGTISALKIEGEEKLTKFSIINFLFWRNIAFRLMINAKQQQIPVHIAPALLKKPCGSVERY